MKKMYKQSLASSFGVLVYIVLVSSIMQNGDRIFGKEDNWLSPIAFLLLFTLSALVVGSLMLGKPVLLFLDGKKKEAVSIFTASIICMAVFTIIFLSILALIK